MPTGIVIAPSADAANLIDDVVEQARRAFDIGVRQVWLAQQFDFDAIAAVPVLVTDDPAVGRAAATEGLAFYDTIPSYQKVVAREGLASAVDLAVIGSADEVAHRLADYRDAGATDIVLSPLQRGNSVALQFLWRVAAAL